MMQRRSSARVLAHLAQQTRAERYWQYQVWRDVTGSEEGPRPLEFDKGGLTIRQRAARFVKRVGRSINGD